MNFDSDVLRVTVILSTHVRFLHLETGIIFFNIYWSITLYRNENNNANGFTRSLCFPLSNSYHFTHNSRGEGITGKLIEIFYIQAQNLFYDPS